MTIHFAEAVINSFKTVVNSVEMIIRYSKDDR